LGKELNTADFFQQMCHHLDDMPHRLPSSLSSVFATYLSGAAFKALVFIAFINQEYGVALSHEELSEAERFQDIFDLIKAKS
jgi:hypothetical protein